MVKEFGLVVKLSLNYRNRGDHFVTAEEIETTVKCLMEGDNKVRKKVKEVSEMARKAVAEGGSSFALVGDLINDIIGGN